MVADCDKCFRVSGIPDDYTDSQIRALLVKELRLDDDVLIEIFSLARNPLRQGERIATLSFSQIPAELSERGQQYIKLPPTSPESRGPRREVFIDSHFEGFTPLHTADDDDCYMDIVALSGLNGHAFGSFKAKGRSYMWLRDALPLDIRKARIFIYGYDTNPETCSFQNIWDLESTFRRRLRMLRAQPDSMRRPLVIIAHSLGGIIAKAAIIKMAESTIDGDDATYRSLRGTLLFGVPSQGMDIESLVPMVPVVEMRTLLSSLDKNNSPTLRELGENFPRKIKELPDFEGFNFYETRESPTARKNQEKGNWEMNGPPTVLVTPFSATQGKLGNEPGHRVIALNRTHSEMIKFSGANDNDYETTLECLKEIEKRITCESSVWPRHQLSKNEQGCLQSLSFIEQHSREFDPKIYASEGTCTWIREHKNYCAWLATSPGLLWIMGPPGAGKSTLMKFLVNSEREARRGRDIIAAFFVHGRGNEIQKSHPGIYRSLLHQLLPYCPGPLAKLTELYTARTNIRGEFDKKWTWEEKELRDFFTTTIVAESLQRTITVFVDALDEMGEGPAADLIAYFERLHDKDILRHSKFRLCFSCRYYPKLAEESSLSIAVEKENSRDINSLIKNHKALLKFRLSDKDTITKLIIERAGGIFQWVSLVLDDVVKLRRRGEPAAAVIARINEVPGTLKGIYDALLVFENEHDREQTLILFQWILFSSKPLGLEDLRLALAINANMPHNTFEEITQSRYFYQLEDMPTAIQSLSKGLARVTEHAYRREKDIGCVETIHQSVNDYLLGSGLKDLARPLSRDPEGLAHFQLSRSCIKLLHIILQRTPLEFPDDSSPDSIASNWIWVADRVPLATYAQTQWLNHVTKAERYEIEQHDLLDNLPWRKDCGTLPTIFTSNWAHNCWVGNHRCNEETPVAGRFAGSFVNQYSYSWDPVHLLALAGIQSALDKMEQVEPDIYSRMDLLGQTTLSFALAGGHEKIVASAMNILAEHHVRNDKFVMSPLILAVIHGREDWVRAITSKGADLDQLNIAAPKYEGNALSALYHAWDKRDEKIVRLLLSVGADPFLVFLEKGVWITVVHKAIKETDEWSRNMLPLLLESARKLHPAKKLPNCIEPNTGQSTLFYAIMKENVPLVQLLLDSSACRNHLEDSQTEDGLAFHVAAARGLEGMVKLLLNSGIDPRTNSHGVSPLHCAAANGHSSVVRLLLCAGARPTGLRLDNEHQYSCLVCISSKIHHLGTGESSMTSASSSYHVKDLSVSSKISSDYIRPPLEMAVKNGHTSVVKAVLDVANTTEVDTNAKVEEIRNLPWGLYAQLAAQDNLPDVLQVLLKSGVDLNARGFSKEQQLHVAALEGFVELARILLQFGADPMLTDVSGETVLQTAIEYDHMEIVSMLLDWRDAHGRTFLMLEIFTSGQITSLPSSVRRNRLLRDIELALLRTEYNFNVQDNKGLTTLSYAVIENMPEIIHILLNNGRSDPNTQNRQGETPLMMAAAAGYERILQRLLVCPLTDIAIEDEDGLTAVDHARRAGNNTAVALLREKQDALLVQRLNTLAKKTSDRGRAWPLHTALSAGMMGALRRLPR